MASTEVDGIPSELAPREREEEEETFLEQLKEAGFTTVEVPQI